MGGSGGKDNDRDGGLVMDGDEGLTPGTPAQAASAVDLDMCPTRYYQPREFSYP
jgi:hypothetical protein